MSKQTERVRAFEKQRKHRRISWRRWAAERFGQNASPKWACLCTVYMVHRTLKFEKIPHSTKVKRP